MKIPNPVKITRNIISAGCERELNVLRKVGIGKTGQQAMHGIADPLLLVATGHGLAAYPVTASKLPVIGKTSSAIGGFIGNLAKSPSFGKVLDTPFIGPTLTRIGGAITSLGFTPRGLGEVIKLPILSMNEAVRTQASLNILEAAKVALVGSAVKGFGMLASTGALINKTAEGITKSFIKKAH